MKEVVAVGVRHGVTAQDCYGSIIHLEVEPPDDFLNRVGLPDESNVGIEITNSACSEPVVTRDTPPPLSDAPEAEKDAWYEAYDRTTMLSGEYFFRRLAQTLRRSESVVIPVDDEQLAITQLNLAQKLQNPEYISEHGTPRQVRKSARRAAKLEYVTNILRDAAIVEKISERAGALDAVVLGAGHAALLCANPRLQAELGLNITETYLVTPDIQHIQYKSSGEVVGSQVHSWAGAEINELAQNIHIEAESDTTGKPVAW